MSNQGWTKIPTKPKNTNSNSKVITKSSTPLKKEPKAIDGSKLKARKPLREHNSNNKGNSNTAVTASKPVFIPKTIQDCNQAIGNVNDVRSHINLHRDRTPDRPNVWLNELVRYFVNKCSITEKNIPKSQYLTKDWITLNKDVEKLLVNTLQDSQEYFIKSHIRSTLFHESLLNMIEESCNNRAIAGYKLILYVLAKHFTQDCVKSISDRVFFHASQAHAYRSNPNTCIPLLWAMGLPFLHQASQTGSQSIEVFEKAMLPLLEQKPTNHYVVFYLDSIITTYFQNQQTKLQLFSTSAVVKIIQTCFSANFEAGDQNKLKSLIEKIPVSSYNFEKFLDTLDTKNENFKNYLLKVLFGLLNNDRTSSEACNIWSVNYSGKITESAILLKYINENLDKIEKISSSKVIENKSTKQLLGITCLKFQKTNQQLLDSSAAGETKQAIRWVESMCVEIIDYCKNSSSSSYSSKEGRSNSGASSGVSGFFSLFLTLIYYTAITLWLIAGISDLYSANGHWQKNYH